MIPRYTRPQMAEIWSAQARFRIWFEIEAHAAAAMAELGMIPKAAAKAIWDKGSKATFDVARIDEIEREVKHDVIAFLTHLAEHVGPEARFVHAGLTSSDVLDTCFNLQLVRAADLLLADLDQLLAALRRRAFEHKHTVTVGRSHGIHAEPTTFGLKLAYAWAEFARARERLLRAREEVATCAISGAVGTFANVDPRGGGLCRGQAGTEAGAGVDANHPARPPRHVLRHAGRDRLFAGAARRRDPPSAAHRSAGGGGILRPGAEGLLRHAAQAQPGAQREHHRPCPHGAQLRLPAMENVALWHERDISHSSVERMIGPDATVSLDFALHRMTGVIDRLVVYPDNMRFNLQRLGGLVHSQRVLIALTQKGVARDEAYRLVQRSAMRVWQGDGDFLNLLKADPEVSKSLNAAELESLFDLDFHSKHVEQIFDRVFGAVNATTSPAPDAPGDDDDRADQGRDHGVHPGIAQVEVPAGRAEDKGADEGADDAGDQVAQQATGTADERAGQPTGDDADDGHDDQLLGVHVHVQALPSCHRPTCPCAVDPLATECDRLAGRRRPFASQPREGATDWGGPRPGDVAEGADRKQRAQRRVRCGKLPGGRAIELRHPVGA